MYIKGSGPVLRNGASGRDISSVHQVVHHRGPSLCIVYIIGVATLTTYVLSDYHNT